MNKGAVLRRLGRYEDAAVLLRQANGICDKVGMQSDLNCITAGEELGITLLLGGKPREAAGVLERTIATAAPLEATSPGIRDAVADCRFALAKALWDSGMRSARIWDLVSAAEEEVKAAKRGSEETEIAGWKVGHPGP